MDDAREASRYFVDAEQAPGFKQMEGLETTVLTDLHGERTMMVLNATLSSHSVPIHEHPHEQVGMVLRGRAILRIGDEEREVEPGDSYVIPGGVPHSDTCLGDEPFIMLDIVHQVCEDFIDRVREA